MTHGESSTSAPSSMRAMRSITSALNGIPLWERVLLFALLLGFFALANVYSARYYHNVVDDSLISLTYVKNFATGHGLVFNVGERVEGYTNFLWVFALAPVHVLAQLFGAEFVPFAVETTIVFATLDLLLIYLIARRLFGHGAPALLALALCAADNAYAVWSIQALEGHFLVFWALLATYLLGSNAPRRGLWIGLCVACVVMTRMDGALFGLALGGAQLLSWLTRQPQGAAHTVLTPKQLGQAVLAGALVYGSYYAWRYAYYGYPLPNTYYLKVGTSKIDAWARGITYVRSYFQERSWVPLLALPSIAWARRPVVRTLWLWMAAHLFYLCYVGGDFYPGHRFFVVLMPVFALLSLQTLWGLVELVAGRLEPARASLVRAPMILATLMLIASVYKLGLVRGPLQSEIMRWRDVAEAQFRFMRWVGQHAAKGSTIVVGDIGSAGYYAGLHVYDVFGVIDPVIAHRDVPLGSGKVGHEKVGNLQYFMPKHPTYIKTEYLTSDCYPLGYFLNTDMPPGDGVKGIWQHDDLPKLATPVHGSALDFDSHDEHWVTSGDAFANWPTRGAGRGQQSVVGHKSGYLSSYTAARGDGATGTIVSPPFELTGEVMTLRVAGGHDPKHLRVSLLVDGRAAFSATGFNTEWFGRKLWKIAPYKGKQATLEVVDELSRGWGHIMVDEVQQWTRKSPH